MRSLLIAALTTTLLTAACSSDASDPGATSKGSLPSDATVTYSFHDSSVPPPYHRSYTLTVTQEESRIVVDSYGDVLADETTTTSPQVWQQLSADYPQVAGLSADNPTDGCVGGTSFDLDVMDPGATLQQLSVDLCGGSNEQVEEQVTLWISPARQQFAAMDVLAPEGE